MFNVYIDDSGTSPNQPVAIASALIIPAKRIKALDDEWRGFLKSRRIHCFHTSECIARNEKSAFAKWTDAEVTKALIRVRQITKKFSVKAVSWSVKKADYDELVPREMREEWGQYHYTWAIHHVLKMIREWKGTRSVPIEYLFDWLKDRPRREVERAMKQEEELRPGQYEGHYAFGKRCDTPALQCTDLLAWSCYLRSRWIFDRSPMSLFSQTSFNDFRHYQDKQWLRAGTVNREDFSRVIQRHLTK